MKRESGFKSETKKIIGDLFPGCIMIDLDPNEHQGIPDLLILFEDQWASLEFKRFGTASRRPNQDWWVDRMNDMSFSSFIYPENKEEVLDDLQRAFGIKRYTRHSRG